MKCTVCLNATYEGATSGGRAGTRVRLHQNISYNNVTLKENNKPLTTTPTVQEGETSLDTSPEGNQY